MPASLAAELKAHGKLKAHSIWDNRQRTAQLSGDRDTETVVELPDDARSDEERAADVKPLTDEMCRMVGVKRNGQK